MIHAREDYNRFQDPAKLIPEEEPVFLLRGQDKFAPNLVLQWAANLEAEGGPKHFVDSVKAHAQKMLDWQKAVKSKMPDYIKDGTDESK